MFCPKCGSKNTNDVKFCRRCGTDLSNVSDALSGRLSNQRSNLVPLDEKGKPIRLDSMFSTGFIGIAFLIVSTILGLSGQDWWFWMLIPAFAMIGTALAQFIQWKNAKNELAKVSFADPQTSISGAIRDALPPQQTEYVAPESRYRTGDLVPPSVTEKTTNLLHHDAEGETKTLPKEPK